MKRSLVSIFALILVCITVISCGNNNPSGTPTSTISSKPSGLTFRVFISNSLFPSATGTGGGGPFLPVFNIVNAKLDVLSASVVNLSGTSAQPSLMALAPNLKFTLVYSQIGNTVTVVDNSTETVATVPGSTTSVPIITLPGLTESIAVSPFATTAYVAVPTAPVFGQSPGAVEVLNLQNGSTIASIPVPGAHFVVCSPDGNHLLVFSDNSDVVTVITTISIGTNTDPRSYVTGFDRPVWGVFTGNSSAYVMNCGAQCGGKAAGVSVLNVGASSPASTTPLSAATYALLNNTTLYVAGTPPGGSCAGTVTAATTCGRLSVIDTASMTVTGSVVITDGYHDRMQLSQNGQLYIGSHTCTNINVAGGEVRGCLSIFNTISPSVVIPPNIGDVTGIQQIRGRDIVYVVQNSGLGIYDADTNQLQVTPGNTQNDNGQVDIVGQLYDVKLVN